MTFHDKFLTGNPLFFYIITIFLTLQLDANRAEWRYMHSSCESDQFKCASGECIDRGSWCDEQYDCSDESDENFCHVNHYATCPNDHKYCVDRTQCYPIRWKCDGVTDCRDLSDEANCFTGILALPEVNSRRKLAASWMKSKRNTLWGWNEDTPRAIVAMYLSGSASFNGTSQEEELMAKQLELKVSISLLRNETDQLIPNILAQYINALLVTCHNPHNFYGFDLVSILKRKMQSNMNKTHPLAYLALCNANDTVSAEDVNFLFEILNRKSEFPIWTDIQAAAVMALSCITKQSLYAHHLPNLTLATDRFKNQQHSDGSFGNIYTTALVLQALLSNGYEKNSDWNLEAAISFLKSKQNLSDGSFGDFVATYWILPILNGKSLTNISRVQCVRKQREGRHHDIVKSKLGPRIYVQYSLYIGNDLDFVHSMSLRIPQNITVYDLMQLASESDPKYKFKGKRILDNIYIYSLSDRANDPETGMFWLLYLSNLQNNGTATLSTESPDKVFVSSGEHIIMWYKLADIRQK